MGDVGGTYVDLELVGGWGVLVSNIPHELNRLRIDNSIDITSMFLGPFKKTPDL